MGTADVAQSIELQNFMAAKLKVNFFVLLRVTLLVPQFTLSAQKQHKVCWYVKFSRWKGELWIQEVIRAHLDSHQPSINEVVSRCYFAKQVIKIRWLKVLFVKKLL